MFTCVHVCVLVCVRVHVNSSCSEKILPEIRVGGSGERGFREAKEKSMREKHKP